DVQARRELVSFTWPGVAYLPSPDNKMLTPSGRTVVINTRNAVKLWDLTTRRERASLTGKNWWGARGLSPDQRTFAAATSDYTVELWDVSRQRKIATLSGHT